MKTKSDIITMFNIWAFGYKIDKHKTILIGSAALVMQNILKNHECNDLDILVDEETFNKIKIHGTITNPCDPEELISLEFPNNVTVRVNKLLTPPYTNYIGQKFDIIDGIPVANPKFLLELYLSYNRDKDVDKIHMLNDYMNNEFLPSIPGYHVTTFDRGTFGSSTKIQEEVNEIKDAELQGNKIMILVELSDLYGAIEGYLKTNFPDLTMDDIRIMSHTTKRAFENGTRSSRD